MEGSVLRIIDANLNRAREALRVLEDYARFVLDDAAVCARLKGIRHELTGATRVVAADAIVHRDTPGDVGTGISTDAESSRQDAAHVITAAGKRLGEALRTIEEYLKVTDPPAAGRVERLRYDFYETERRIALTLRPPAFGHVRLYVLITESLCRRPWLEVAEAALLGGADCIQLREKQMDGGEFLRRAARLVELCRGHGALCIINDRPDIAVLSGADGVHVGQTDLPAADARRIVGNRGIVGVSTHDLEQARRAVLDGADYIGVGPVFPSSTKPREILPGLDFARTAAGAVKIPCVAIAGITAENAPEVMSTGVSAVAVSSAIIAAADPRAAAEAIRKNILNSAVGQTFLPASGFQPELSESVGQTFLSASGFQPDPPAAVGQAFLPASGFQPDPPAAVGQAFLPASGFQPDRPLRKRRRRLPHWTCGGATYFITFRVLHGELTMPERLRVLEHVKSGDGRFYELFCVVAMPDHVHMLLRPIAPYDLPRIMKGIKGVTGRIINDMRQTRGSIWQDESFDRIVRDGNEFDEKVQYMYNNPVKAGLCEDPEAYPARHFSPG